MASAQTISSIPAVQTWYNGFFHRSRLEARWATFFKTMDIEYEYEIETYNLYEAGYYLPDFWLPHYRAWVEIKGTQPTQKEREKLRALTEMTDSYGYIFSGQIEVPSINDLINPATRVYARRGHFQAKLFDDFSPINKTNVAACAYVSGKELHDNYRWSVCFSCGKPAICANGYMCKCGNTSINYNNLVKLVDAYKTARAARFEYL
jgi:hypothetical protein